MTGDFYSLFVLTCTSRTFHSDFFSLLLRIKEGKILVISPVWVRFSFLCRLGPRRSRTETVLCSLQGSPGPRGRGKAHVTGKSLAGAGGAGERAGGPGHVPEETREGGWKGQAAPGAGCSPPRRARRLLHAPEHGLHKHPQSLDVDPGNEGFAEVHLEPAQQRALRRQGSR